MDRPITPAETIHIRQGANLPHWTKKHAVYSIVIRLGDSLPVHALDKLRLLRKQVEQLANPTEPHKEILHETTERYLDSGYGACWLRNGRIARLMVGALRRFESERYKLHAWCIMPNHVHVVVEPIGSHTLPSIIQSWKSFVAKKANTLLGRKGGFWQSEYYDHILRDEDEYFAALRYVVNNPVKAGFVDWPWFWAVGSSPDISNT